MGVASITHNGVGIGRTWRFEKAGDGKQAVNYEREREREREREIERERERERERESVHRKLYIYIKFLRGI